MAKANVLASLQARYWLPVKAQTLILMLISKIHPKDKEFTRYAFEIDELYELLNVHRQNKNFKRNALKKALNFLQRNLLEIVLYDESGGEVLLTPAWIESPVYEWDKGRVTLRVSETLKPYLLNLQRGNRTQYLLDAVKKFRSDHTLRFFEFCKNYEPRADWHDQVIDGRYVKNQVFKLEDLRRALGVASSKYPAPRHFKQRILDAARKEVNEKTDCRFDIELVKNPHDKRKVEAVKMIIYGPEVKDENPPEEIVSREIPADPPPFAFVNPRDRSLQRRILGIGCSMKMAEVVLNSNYEREIVADALEAIEIYQLNNKIRWPNGILRQAILQKWRSKAAIRKEQEARKAAEKLDAVETKKRIEEGLKNREEEKIKKVELDHEKYMAEYEDRLEVQRSEFAQAIDKTTYMIGVFEELKDLNKDQKAQVEAKIKAEISFGADFNDVYDLAGRMIGGFLFSARNAL